MPLGLAGHMVQLVYGGWSEQGTRLKEPTW